MTNKLAKKFNECFRPQHHTTTLRQKSNNDRDRHHHHHHHHNHSQTPLIPQHTTYNSLYEDKFSCFPLSTTTSAAASLSSSVNDTDTEEHLIEAADDDYRVTPDLTAVYASRRFFISSPGRSNSIVDSLSTVSMSSPEEEIESPPPVVDDGVAVVTFSPDPYADFRRSMEEMVVARGVAREDIEGAWEYLQELLLSYLSLNAKSTHKYIVRAFADVVSSMSPVNNVANLTSTSQSFSSFCANNSYVQTFI